MPISWRVRDAIHGFVELNDCELRVVNSAPYQRLRNVRQLGMAHFVYPGANHTRFEHCLGCVHITDQMYQRICDGKSGELWDTVCNGPDKDRLNKIARLAALTHDLGHAPFSHTAEELFQAPEGWKGKGFSHESQTVRLIRETEIAGIIQDYGIDPEEVIAVATDPSESTLENISSRHDLLILNEILTSEIGSDRCDYLVRDAFHSGQPAGSIDLDRLIHQVTLAEYEGAIYFGIKEGARLVVEQMIANRYAAYVDLYFHKTKRAYEMHLIQFLKLWLPDGHFPDSLDGFLSLTDSRVEHGIYKAAHTPTHPAHGPASRFINRSHFRKAFERVPNDQKGLLPEQVQKFKKKCEEHLGCSGFVDIVEHSGTKMRDDRILVDLGDRTRYLDTVAELISGLETRIWRLRVYSTTDQRDRVRSWCSREWQNI